MTIFISKQFLSTKKLQYFPGEEVRGESQSEKRRNENQAKTGEKYTQLSSFFFSVFFYFFYCGLILRQRIIENNFIGKENCII